MSVMPRAERAWQATPQSVRGARAFVQQSLEDWGADDLVWAATTLVSELATNAVLHARSDFTVDIELAGPQLTVRVADNSSSIPVRRHYDDNAATGRGLVLLESIASEWGTVGIPGGKVIWCTVASTGTNGSHLLASVTSDDVMAQFADADIAGDWGTDAGNAAPRAIAA
jgi:anti-sigma regulatory factor (Ser/Thr protein kinase)